jgi:hypothetical protein
MATKSRPKTRKTTAAQKATMDAARGAMNRGESIKPVAFRAAQGKAAKAAYLQAHL